MGRKNGTWSPIYGQAWDHHKTAAAAAYAAKHGRSIPTDCAPSVVLGWLNRICLWCLANGETGVTATLSTGRLATIAWPEGLAAGRNVLRTGELIRATLRAGGFLEDGPDGERVHDFADHHARILKERRRKRDAKDGEDEPDESADDPAPRSAPPSAESPAEHSAPRSAERSAPTDNDTDNDNDNDNHRARGARGAGGSSSVTATPRKAKPPPSPAEAAARHLAAALGSSLSPCRKAIHALRHAGWPIDRIERAVAEHAQPGDAPWDWAKRARGATEARPTGAAAVAAWAASRREESA